MNFINGQATDNPVMDVFTKKSGLLQSIPIYVEPNGISTRIMTKSYNATSVQEFLKGKNVVRFNAQREDRQRVASVFNTQAFVPTSYTTILDSANQSSIYQNAEIEAYAGMADTMNKALFDSSVNRDYYNASLYGLSYNLIDKTGASSESDVIWVVYGGRNGVYGFTGQQGLLIAGKDWEPDKQVDFTNSREIKGMGKQLYSAFGLQQFHPLSLFKISLASGATGATIKAGLDEALDYIIDEAKATNNEIMIVMKTAVSRKLAEEAGNTYQPGSDFKTSYST